MDGSISDLDVLWRPMDPMFPDELANMLLGARNEPVAGCMEIYKTHEKAGIVCVTTTSGSMKDAFAIENEGIGDME